MTSMAHWPTAQIRGQESFLLSTNVVDLALTRRGAMLAPVTFFPQSTSPIAPYAIAPWAEEPLPDGIPSMLRTLRGDWFCSAFGENAEDHNGRRLPPHGETANLDWHAIAGGETNEGCWLRLGVNLPIQGGCCEATTALLRDHSIVYQRHDLSGLSGPINPGHHATLSFPSSEACPRGGSPSGGSGRLSFSRTIHAQTYVQPTERPENGGLSCFRPDAEIVNFSAVPTLDGATDLTRYPARRGFEDIAIVCADPSLNFAWSAVTFPEQGFAWFALRDSRLLASTLLWFSNGGRHRPPWNGRHVNVMGIEDITAFFHVGIAASCQPNALTERGIRTSLEPNDEGRLSIPYIQGVARIPKDFDRVTLIEPLARQDTVLLIAESGAIAEVACEFDFLRTGKLRELNF